MDPMRYICNTLHVYMLNIYIYIRGSSQNSQDQFLIEIETYTQKATVKPLNSMANGKWWYWLKSNKHPPPAKKHRLKKHGPFEHILPSTPSFIGKQTGYIDSDHKLIYHLNLLYTLNVYIYINISYKFSNTYIYITYTYINRTLTFQKERPHHPNHPPNKNHRGFFPKQQRNQGTIRRGDRQSALAFGLCEATAILRVLEVEVFFCCANRNGPVWLMVPKSG